MSITVHDLARAKAEGRPLAMLTAYDFQTAQILDEAGIPLLLVGDTLGIFMLGYATTIPVTMDAMVHHCQAVSRGAQNAMVIGDLPFGSYHGDLTLGLANATRLVKEGGAQMVKLEGAEIELVRALSTGGVPVMGHLGLTPQSFFTLGGNRVQARTEDAVEALVANARALEAAGAAALVLEAVLDEAGQRVTESLAIPTIGIGAGPHCDGQVLVSTEMLGLSTGPRPRFAKQYANLHEEAVHAAQVFAAEVADGTYPGPEHSYGWAITAAPDTSPETPVTSDVG